MESSGASTDVAYSKMRVLIFDTETTGLPKKRQSAWLEPHVWPHIVSISWMLYDSDRNKTVLQKTYNIKPINWIIPQESTAIHGILHSYAERYGAPLGEVMEEFLNIEYDALVAHNLEFDENVIINAMRWDLGHVFEGFTKPKYCTMRISRPMCNLPYPSGYRGIKPPRLGELYEYVFHKKPMSSRLHGSFYDTKILCDIIKVCEPIRTAIGLSPSDHLITNEHDGAELQGSGAVV